MSTTASPDDRHHGRPLAGRRPVLTLGEPGIDRAWMRRYRSGAMVAAIWHLAVPIVLVVGLASAFGPFGRLYTWQLRTFGSNNPVVLAIPFMPIAFLPALVTRLCRIDRRTPFLLGMRQAFDSKWGPRVTTGPDEVARRLRRTKRVSAAAAAIGAVLLALFVAKGMHDAAVPHAPLGEMSHATLIDPATPLPDAIRVAGVVGDRSTGWAYDYRVHRSARKDVYFALRPKGEPGAYPVSLLEVDKIDPGDDAEIRNMVDPPGAREGIPRLLDAWMAEQLRHAGFRLASHVIVLERRQFGGRNPHPDPLDDIIFCILAATMAISGLISFWIARRAAVRLARTA